MRSRIHVAPPEVFSFDPSSYDRSPELTVLERQYLKRLVAGKALLHTRASYYHVFERLKQPLMDLLTEVGVNATDRHITIRSVFNFMHSVGAPYWAWNRDQWIAYMDLADKAKKRLHFNAILLAYHIGRVQIHSLDYTERRSVVSYLAPKLWGTLCVDASINRIRAELLRYGFKIEEKTPQAEQLRATMSWLMLVLDEPNIDKWNESEFLSFVRRADFRKKRHYCHAIWIGLHQLNIISAAPENFKAIRTGHRPSDGCSENWIAWVNRYCDLRVVETKTMQRDQNELYAVGRWAKREWPECGETPEAWTADVAASLVTYLCNAKVGADRFALKANIERRRGEQLAPQTVKGKLSAMRGFFETLIELELIKRRFSPSRVFRLPSKLSRQIGPRPRDMNDDVWAKLLWAGLNMVESDFNDRTLQRYPIEMLNAITILWLFGGLRSDEMRRLTTACIEWEFSMLEKTKDGTIPTICYLLVPANKYKTEFRKPVAGEIGKAIEAWRAVRPPQPAIMDRKTGKPEDKLFSLRCRLVGARIINTLIEAICEKAGVPTSDSKGKITSHRGRSTIATQLANADEPLSPWELKDWMGHSSIRSTEWYVNQRPKKMARKYLMADSWRREFARIGVILDREAIESGEAAKSGQYKYYDLGDGYCTDRFFSRCSHRMACVRCTLYIPKESTKGQLLEAMQQNEVLYESIPMREDEQLALQGDANAVKELLAKTDGTIAPDGKKYRSLEADIEA